ncbi:MAG: FtsX-like permease family protein [Candidatus Bathyarchaeia archaeon]
MKASKLLAVAWGNLKQRKLRASLTTLGVVIGITTIIAIASLGEGFRLEVRQHMEQGFELDVLIVFPGSFMTGLRGGFSQTNIENITKIDNVNATTPLITLPTAELYNETGVKLGAFTVGAVNFTEMKKILPLRFQLSNGTFPQTGDNTSIVLGYKASVVNGTIVAGVGDNVSLIVRNSIGYIIYNNTFTVSGVLEKGGTSGITNFDYWAFIPLETALEMPFFKENSEPYQIILVKVSNPQYAESVGEDIENLFPPYSVTVFVPSALMRQVDNVLNIVQMFLMAIGSISLLVAGVGIMNIMTVAVMERTREIGILKAIGAKSRTVLGMFLAEAVLIGIIGGVIGVFTGYGLSYGLAQILSNFMQPQRRETVLQTPETQRLAVNPVFSMEWTIVAIVFAIIICIIFGLYPARKASKLNPVEALRYE